MIIMRLEKPGGAIGDEHHQGGQQQDERQGARQPGSQDGAAVGPVQLRTGGELGLVRGLDALQGVPPGAGAIEVGADFGGADGFHITLLISANIFHLVRPMFLTIRMYNIAHIF
jgi:hypothetical protein